MNSDSGEVKQNFLLTKNEISNYIFDNLDEYETIYSCGKINDLKDRFSKVNISKEVINESALREIFHKDKNNFDFSYILSEDIYDISKCRVFNISGAINSIKIWVPVIG